MSFAHSVMQWTTPWPVASARPWLPPDDTLLPVTTPRTRLRSPAPTMFMYVSIIQTMVWLLVFTSGAGMSYSGPMLLPSAAVNRRVIRSSSSLLCCRGSTFTPPLPPPNGISWSAHL